jgi:hypothetical protein
VDSPDVRDVAVVLRTLLLESILEPLAGKNDALGSYAMDSFAQTLARRLAAP